MTVLILPSELSARAKANGKTGKSGKRERESGLTFPFLEGESIGMYTLR